MKSIITNLRDTIIAGIIFLLPLLLIVVMISKAFQTINGLTGKIAGMFGLTSFAGISGSTIVGGISILLICLLCGYLVRFAFFNNISGWLDQKLMSLIPGYKLYREMALSKLRDDHKPLPYKSAAWLINSKEVKQPVFVMQKLADGDYAVFAPSAGNVEEGTILKVHPSAIELDQSMDLRTFKLLFTNLGLGMEEEKRH